MDDTGASAASTDATEICMEAISAALPGVPVTSEVPFERPDAPMVQVARTGGESSEWVDRPIVQILAWGRTDADACSLAMTAQRAVADAARGHPYLSHAEATSLGRDEWAPSGEARYRAQMRLAVNKE